MANLTGSIRADLLGGTAIADTARGKSGPDTINGGLGNDTLSGGDGADRLFGGQGDDVIFGHGPADQLPGSGDIVTTLIISGLDQPVFMSSAPGDPDRLFVVEKTGQIRILDPLTGTTNAVDFLDIPAAQLQTSDEQGVLGMAFHPDYATNGKFYVYVTNAAGNIELREYLRTAGNPDLADGGSSNVILTIPHPIRENHNGGWIGFGPDGYLYISVGDGGGGGDPDNNAQNTGSLLGKMLRIDVNGDDFPGTARNYAVPTDNPFANGAGADEIWAVGLRNSWRASFDRLTGDLYIGDVGQGDREEINFQSAGAPGGANYGWAIREGTLIYDGARPGNLPPDSPLLVDPVLEYAHDSTPNGGFSVTGGYVYRGPGAGMQGVYLYADFVSGQVWSFRVVDGAVIDAQNRTEQLVQTGGAVTSIASFAEDGRGNLYIVSLNGNVHRITPGIGAGDGADFLSGGDGQDTMLGGVGADTLRGDAGDDVIRGGTQGDLIVGGAGRDRLVGGAGNDVFDFNLSTESGSGRLTRDVVTDFTSGEDVLNLATIDAQAGVAGNQRFSFIGSAAFSGEGQIRLMQSAGDVIVLINTTAMSGIDMSIVLRETLVSEIDAGDFIL